MSKDKPHQQGFCPDCPQHNKETAILGRGPLSCTVSCPGDLPRSRLLAFLCPLIGDWDIFLLVSFLSPLPLGLFFYFDLLNVTCRLVFFSFFLFFFLTFLFHFKFPSIDPKVTTHCYTSCVAYPWFPWFRLYPRTKSLSA